jgi:hypothetical protein
MPHDRAAKLVGDVEVSLGVQRDTVRALEQGFGPRDDRDGSLVENSRARPERRIDCDEALGILRATHHIDLAARVQGDRDWIFKPGVGAADYGNRWHVAVGVSRVDRDGIGGRIGDVQPAARVPR